MVRKRSHKALATVNHSAHTPSRPSPSRSSLHRGFAPPLTKSKPMIIAKPAPGRRVKIYNDKAPKSLQEHRRAMIRRRGLMLEELQDLPKLDLNMGLLAADRSESDIQFQVRQGGRKASRVEQQAQRLKIDPRLLEDSDDDLSDLDRPSSPSPDGIEYVAPVDTLVMSSTGVQLSDHDNAYSPVSLAKESSDSPHHPVADHSEDNPRKRSWDEEDDYSANPCEGFVSPRRPRTPSRNVKRQRIEVDDINTDNSQLLSRVSTPDALIRKRRVRDEDEESGPPVKRVRMMVDEAQSTMFDPRSLVSEEIDIAHFVLGLNLGSVEEGYAAVSTTPAWSPSEEWGSSVYPFFGTPEEGPAPEVDYEEIPSFRTEEINAANSVPNLNIGSAGEQYAAVSTTPAWSPSEELGGIYPFLETFVDGFTQEDDYDDEDASSSTGEIDTAHLVLGLDLGPAEEGYAAVSTTPAWSPSEELGGIYPFLETLVETPALEEDVYEEGPSLWTDHTWYSDGSFNAAGVVCPELVTPMEVDDDGTLVDVDVELHDYMDVDVDYEFDYAFSRCVNKLEKLDLCDDDAMDVD